MEQSIINGVTSQCQSSGIKRLAIKKIKTNGERKADLVERYVK